MKKKNHRRKKRDVLRRKSLTPPGAPPGVIDVLPNCSPADCPAPQILLSAFGPDRLVEKKLDDLRFIPEALHAFPVTWVDVEGIGDGRIIQELGTLFGLHPLALEDVVHAHQRPKVEEYGDVLFIVLRTVSLDDRCHTEQICLFVGPTWLVTIQEGTPGDPFDRVRQRMRDPNGRLRTAGSDYLAYALVDALIDGYFPVLEEFAERLDTIEDDCIAGRGDGLMDRLHQAKSDILLLRRSIWPQREAVAALMRDSTPRITESTRIYLRDVYDHTVQIVELAELYRELIADLRDLYMSALSNRINETMRVLTIISTLFIPLTFIAGLYGMNFDTKKSPFNMPELELYYGYPLCLALMVLSTLAFLAFFVHKGWIGRRFFKRVDSNEEEQA